MQRILPVLLFACSLVLAYFCYRPGLYGSFLFDDIINIVENTALKIQTFDMTALMAAAFSMGHGISARPLSMASFALDYYFNGPAPFGFKLTNLFIHLLNGVCIYVLTALILAVHRRSHPAELGSDRLRWISLAVASAWLLHPLNLTSVLYIVQRMNSLSALFTLLGLTTYVYGRLRQLDGHAGWGWILSAFLLFTPLAVLSKQNGVLLPAFMLLTEIVLLNFQAPKKRTRLMLAALFTATVALPATVLIAYTLYKPAWLLVGYNIRDFTLPERLMTETRVLWFYLRLIIVPDISQLGLQHDDIAISRGMLAPFSTLFATIGISLLAGAAFMIRKRHPIAAFGIAFFLLGHSIESSVVALEIAHEHRNYLPIYGILLAVFYYLLLPAWPARKEREPASGRDTLRVRQMLAVVLVLFFGAVTAIRAGHWANEYGMKLMEVAHHPDSLRANSDAAYIYAFLPASSHEQAEEYYQLAFSHYQKAAHLSSTDTSGLFGMIGLNARHGKPIKEHWVQELESRLEHQPFAPAAVNSLMHLEKCLTQGICKHSPQDMARLLKAALRNPALYGKGRSNVQFAWSNFLFIAMHDRDTALKAAYKALEATPGDPETRMTLIKFLLNQGAPDGALRQISRLRQLDTMQIYGAQLDELEKLATMATRTSP